MHTLAGFEGPGSKRGRKGEEERKWEEREMRRGEDTETPMIY